MSHTIINSQTRRNLWKNVGVWTLQVAVAGLFMFAGVMKLILPIEAMTQQMAMPGSSSASSACVKSSARSA